MGQEEGRSVSIESQNHLMYTYTRNVLIGTDLTLILGPVEGRRVLLRVATQHHGTAHLSVLNLGWALL